MSRFLIKILLLIQADVEGNRLNTSTYMGILNHIHLSSQIYKVIMKVFIIDLNSLAIRWTSRAILQKIQFKKKKSCH